MLEIFAELRLCTHLMMDIHTNAHSHTLPHTITHTCTLTHTNAHTRPHTHAVRGDSDKQTVSSDSSSVTHTGLLHRPLAPPVSRSVTRHTRSG